MSIKQRLTRQQHDDAVRAENAAKLDARAAEIVYAAKKAGRPLKQRELFALTTGMNYTQYQAAMKLAVEYGDIEATGVTTARRYTVCVES